MTKVIFEFSKNIVLELNKFIYLYYKKNGS